jgi:formylglycine-generating enzyme required for sulfatase activity
LYSGSDDIHAVAWYDGNSGDETHPVGQKQANSFGLYDMTGNVWEWCWDYFDSYSANEVVDPIGKNIGSGRVIRGGAWNCYKEKYLRITTRGAFGPGGRSNNVGFRLARTLQK